MRILLIEDDVALGEGIHQALVRESYTVDWLQDGSSALHALLSETFDLAVLDLGLPRMDGLEVLRRLRDSGPNLPVLILTARDATEDRIAGLDKFKDGTINILVASDVAARGLDIKGVSHVFNYDAPWHPDDYVHRIGRTGRAGASGKAYTFITEEDAEALANIEKLIGTTIPEITVADPVGSSEPAPKPAKARDDEPRQPRRRTSRSGEGKARAPKVDRVREEEPREDVVREARAREEKPRAARVREERPRSAERRPAASKPRRSQERNDGPDDGWNGPMPDFLSVGFGES